MPSIVFRANVARSVRARCAVSTWSLGASAREAHRGPVGGGGAEAGRHTLDTGNAFVRERPEKAEPRSNHREIEPLQLLGKRSQNPSSDRKYPLVPQHIWDFANLFTQHVWKPVGRSGHYGFSHVTLPPNRGLPYRAG